MSIIEIKAIGNLFIYYYSDLRYINNFRLFKQNGIPIDTYIKKEIGTFKSFVDEFRVARNYPKEDTIKVLVEILNFIKSSKNTDINGLAGLLKDEGLTFGKAVSLSSKVLFLNNPTKIYPLDGNVKKSLKMPTINNDYTEYLNRVKKFKTQNIVIIEKILAQYENTIKEIEKDFDIPNIESIRINKFVDKLLWTIGKAGLIADEIYK